MKIAPGAVNAIHVLVAVLFLLACASVTPVATTMPTVTAPVETVTPPITVEETAVIPPTFTATLTLSPTYAPTETATPTIDWSYTPTQIWPATPSIIEVTPIGGQWGTPTPETMAGTYLPSTMQNVRSGPGVDYPVVRKVSARQIVYGWLSSLPIEAWLCVNPACTEWVAMVYDWKDLGVFTYD